MHVGIYTPTDTTVCFNIHIQIIICLGKQFKCGLAIVDPPVELFSVQMYSCFYVVCVVPFPHGGVHNKSLS